jgi:hypothetical protein
VHGREHVNPRQPERKEGGDGVLAPQEQGQCNGQARAEERRAYREKPAAARPKSERVGFKPRAGQRQPVGQATDSPRPPKKRRTSAGHGCGVGVASICSVRARSVLSRK